MDQKQKPRERSFIIELVPDRRPTRGQALRAVRITVVLVVLLGILTLIGLPFWITLWAWVKLLIVPAVIAAGGLWFTERRSQDEALQAYLDKMTELLVVHKLGKHRDDKYTLQGDPVRTVAWARTKTVLRRLDGGHKGAVLRFLNEADLIKKGYPVIGSLAGAHLVDADLKGSNLKDAALQGVDLRRADLRDAKLNGADLSRTKLRKANLRNADLSNAEEVTNERLEQQAKSLKGATMPNGQKYEEWLKSKDSGDDEENSGPS